MSTPGYDSEPYTEKRIAFPRTAAVDCCKLPGIENWITSCCVEASSGKRNLFWWFGMCKLLLVCCINQCIIHAVHGCT